MILIATDEAGYGPTLGPLVVTATRWDVPPSSRDADDRADAGAFVSLTTPAWVDGIPIVVDDSKRVHVPASARKKSSRRSPNQTSSGGSSPEPDSASASPASDANAADPLTMIATAAAHWCGQRPRNHDELLGWLTRVDGRTLHGNPPQSTKTPSWQRGTNADRPLAKSADVLQRHWQQEDAAQLQDCRSTMVFASQMNRRFGEGFNKADLLGETTLSLIASQIDKLRDRVPPECPVAVYCDRLGGRRYYAGLIQHHFAEDQISVVSETRSHSEYLVRLTSGHQVNIHFTVKGDSFPPVAMSSCLSKYLRESAMRRFNDFFANQQPGLKPTAGYPNDAKRFLTQTKSLRQRLGIHDADLIRTR